MKKILFPLAATAALLLTANVQAYNAGVVDEVCKKPKFTSFSLPEFSATNKVEVAPESAFSLMISNNVDPTTLKVSAKKKALPVTVTDKNSFFLVTGKIPAEYTGQFVRIDVQVTARLGCKGLDGWLVKVAAK
jgi:hypothetical protein